MREERGMEDSAIIGLYWERNEQAIQETDVKYGPYCHTIAYNILENQEDSEECVNDTWLRAWNSMPPQRPNYLRLFLGKITRNLSLDVWKNKQAGKRGGGELALALDELTECVADTKDVEGALQAKELAETIERFLHTLPKRDRELFFAALFLCVFRKGAGRALSSDRKPCGGAFIPHAQKTGGASCERGVVNMTSMDILEALGQTQEELLRGCGQVLGGTDNRKADRAAIVKYRRVAAGLIAAAAVLLLVYVGRGAFISRSFDSMSFGSSNSTSTAESAEITADTAEEESVVEESEAVEMEEELTAESALEESSTSTTSSEETTVAAADESVAEKESAGMESGTQTESATLEILQLGEVYIPIFATSSLSDEEYTQRMELVALVQEEINAALSPDVYETLPVYHFAHTEESATNQNEGSANATVDLIEKLGDYPVITAGEAEELLRQEYYISPTGFSEEDIDNAEVASVKLQYLMSAETQIYMPYYQFTVVIEGDMVMDCYVPAVSSEYLEGTLRGGAVE